MATMANWNGHTFVVSPQLIRSYTELTIKGSCETTTKNTEKQKYVEHKYGEIPEISMTVSLNAQTGVTDVYKEAMEYVQEATDGACAYFYLGGSKLIPATMMLTSAEVTEIVSMPGMGNKWISCDVKLKFQQGSKSDGGGGDSTGSGGSQKESVKTYNLRDVLQNGAPEDLKNQIQVGLNKLKNDLAEAKTASAGKFANLSVGTGGMQYQGTLIAQAKQAQTKATQLQANSAVKKEMTMGRSCEITTAKITLVPTAPKLTLDAIK